MISKTCNRSGRVSEQLRALRSVRDIFNDDARTDLLWPPKAAQADDPAQTDGRLPSPLPHVGFASITKVANEGW